MRQLDASKPVHATCVAIDGKGLLILGKSGAGKSALGLSLMALGGVLVADDRVKISRHEDDVLASCPDAICGLIEARGVGILNAAHVQDVPLSLVVDMERREVDRLPETRQISVLERSLPLLYRVEGLHFSSAIFQLMRYGRTDT